jgi:hypothetical protein
LGGIFIVVHVFSDTWVSNFENVDEEKAPYGFYGRLAKASVPKASSPKWSGFLPRVIVAPDLPISRRSKRGPRDVTINNGTHWHGLALVNPVTSKLNITLDLHIKTNVPRYRAGSIEEIDVSLITHRPRHVTSYGMKGLKRVEFETDDVLIFPRSVSELPTNTLGT